MDCLGKNAYRLLYTFVHTLLLFLQAYYTFPTENATRYSSGRCKVWPLLISL